MKKIITVFCLLFSLLFLQKATAQQINTAKLDSLFDILASKNLMMDSVAISKDNKIVYKKSFGYRYIDGSKKIPADENTKYRIGSITKLFTSVMTFQLVEEGKLSLDTKLAAFFPQIKNAEKITIADMMHHRSGIHDASNDTIYMRNMYQAQSKKDILNILSKCSSDFEPDTKSSYSNSNFTLLGYIIEQLDKDSYEASLKKRIINKLHLKNTYVGKKLNNSENESLPYLLNDNKWETDTALINLIGKTYIVAGGAGAIASTPTDLNIFINALFDNKLINVQSLQQDTTVRGDFGMDIYKVPFYDKLGWGHNGNVPPFYADLYKFVKDNITVAVCYNGVNYRTNDILIDILSCCFNRPFNLSDFEPVKVDTSILNKYVGTYSSKNIPLKIKIYTQKNQLYAQATGQPAFPLTAISEKEFIFKQAGINMLFDTDKNTFTLKQGGGVYLFIKK